MPGLWQTARDQLRLHVALLRQLHVERRDKFVFRFAAFFARELGSPARQRAGRDCLLQRITGIDAGFYRRGRTLDHRQLGLKVGFGGKTAVTRYDPGCGSRQRQGLLLGGDVAVECAAVLAVDVGIGAVEEKITHNEDVGVDDVHQNVAIRVRAGDRNDACGLAVEMDVHALREGYGRPPSLRQD